MLNVCLLISIVYLPLSAAENWPQWRGPLGSGVAADGDYPVKFSAGENVAWKVELPGLGSSTPAVWGNQIFLTCGMDGQDGAICYGLDGNEQWRETLGEERAGKHANGSGSNPSPVTDGKQRPSDCRRGSGGRFVPGRVRRGNRR
jgi:hypothetical protein